MCVSKYIYTYRKDTYDTVVRSYMYPFIKIFNLFVFLVGLIFFQIYVLSVFCCTPPPSSQKQRGQYPGVEGKEWMTLEWV